MRGLERSERGTAVRKGEKARENEEETSLEARGERGPLTWCWMGVCAGRTLADVSSASVSSPSSPPPFLSFCVCALVVLFESVVDGELSPDHCERGSDPDHECDGDARGHCHEGV